MRVAETIPAGVTITSVRVWPERIELSHPWDAAQILVTGEVDAGQQLDLTRMAQCTSMADVVTVDASGQVRPLRDGKQTLTLMSLVSQLRWKLSSVALQNRFRSVMCGMSPTLSKMGCNSGTCHGSKDGQRGFKLSLRGYDFQYDHRALTDEIEAQRFNRANPDQSLMLLKASGSIPHVGGMLTSPGARHYDLIRKWITSAHNLDLQTGRVAKIELLPSNPILPRESLKQQMVVIATYADGWQRDVTADAFVESGNIEVLSAGKTGIVTALRRGEAPILARYEGAYTATTITIMGDRSGFAWDDQTPTTAI